MLFPMTDDEKIARDWINAVERNRVREADIYPQLKAWVHQISATDILDAVFSVNLWLSLPICERRVQS